MITKQWKREKIADGKYYVRLSGGRIPGLILGGNHCYVVQHGGNQWPETFRTINEACEALVCKHIFG